MSWYRVYEIDVLRVGQLFLQQNIDSIYPSAGTVLYTDGSGGTFWSTAGAGGGGGDPSPSSGLTQLQLVSTVDGLGQIYTSTSAAGVTGDQLYSTVRNLGTAGYISSAQLQSTVRNLGTAGYISSAQLQSTVRNLGSAGYISSSQLTSTVTGLSGSAGGQGVSSLFGVVSSGLSTIALFTSNTSNYFLPTLSNNYSTNLQSTVEGLGTAGYISTSQLFSTVSGIGTGGGGLSPSQLISTTEGLGTAGYISTSQLFSTVAGIGTGGGGGLSPSQLISTTEGLGTAGYISTSQLFSTVAGIGTGGGGLTPNQLISTTEGLGTAGYVSTSQLAAYVSTQIQLNPSGTYGELFYLNYSITTGTYQALQTSITTAPLQTVITNINGNVIDDLVAGFQTTSTLPSFIPPGFWTITLFSQPSDTGLSMYAALYSRTSGGSETLIASNTPKVVPTSFTQWQSFLSVPYTNIPAGDGVLLKIFVNNAQSQPRSLSNYFEANLYSYVNTTFGTIVPDAGLTSTVRGLGTIGYISSSQLYSTINTSLTSTSQGLGTIGYISATQLFSTVEGQQTSLATSLASTAIGLGTAGYISTTQLFSTVAGQQITTTSALNSTVIGLGSINYISAPQLFSTVSGQQTGLTSTVIGLGTMTYISAPQLISTTTGQQLSLISTAIGLGTLGYISSTQLISTNTAQQLSLTSTTIGLGTLGYISSTQLISTTKGLQDYISTIVTTPGNTTGTVIYLNYSVTASPYKALEYVTTTAATTNLPTTLSGNTSNIPVSQFQTDFTLPTFIPAGIWDLNLFAYTNDINHVFVYATLYSRNGGGAETLIATSAVEPIITTVQEQYVISLTVPYTPILANTTLVLKLFANNNVNQTHILNTLYEGATYTHMHTTFGTIIPAEVFASTVAGLGTAGYISSSQLFSTVSGISINSITPTELISTSIGLATFGYISTSQLFSTVAGIGTGGGGGGITTTQLVSTAVGLATLGYISSSQLFSTVAGIGTGGGGGGITTQQLQSTTAGLGTASYASTSTLYNPIIGTQVRFPPINVPSILIQDWSTPVSTVALFTSNTSNYYKNALVNFSTPLFSTVAGLGTASYASTTLIYLPNISTKATLPFPVIGVNPLSTVSSSYGTFSTLTATNTYLGGLSTQNAIYFYGLEGTFDRTVLSEQLISTGTQEFLIFKGSSPAENIRLQASGSLVFETGAAPSVFSSAATQSTPTLILTPSRTVGINCNAPAYTLDISGSANITGAASVGGTTTVTGVLTSRVRVVAPTITTDQTLLPSDTSTYFFYTTFSPSLNINVPSPAAAGSGWTVTIQNAPASDQVIFVQTTPVQTLSRGDTVRIFTDGISWYFI